MRDASPPVTIFGKAPIFGTHNDFLTLPHITHIPTDKKCHSVTRAAIGATI